MEGAIYKRFFLYTIYIYIYLIVIYTIGPSFLMIAGDCYVSPTIYNDIRLREKSMCVIVMYYITLSLIINSARE